MCSSIGGACGQRSPRNPLKLVPSLKVVAAVVKTMLPVPQIFFVVLGLQVVEERIDATVAVGQAGDRGSHVVAHHD